MLYFNYICDSESLAIVTSVFARHSSPQWGTTVPSLAERFRRKLDMQIDMVIPAYPFIAGCKKRKKYQQLNTTENIFSHTHTHTHIYIYIPFNTHTYVQAHPHTYRHTLTHTHQRIRTPQKITFFFIVIYVTVVKLLLSNSYCQTNSDIHFVNYYILIVHTSLKKKKNDKAIHNHTQC